MKKSRKTNQTERDGNEKKVIEMFDPQEMQRRVDKLKAEGRFPSPEVVAAALEKVRLEYQKRVDEARGRKQSNKKGGQ